MNALPKMPYHSTKIEEIGFSTKLERDFCLLVINSSLFYLYWSVYGNLRDLPKSLIELFPVPNQRRLLRKATEISQLQERITNAIYGAKQEFRKNNNTPINCKLEPPNKPDAKIKPINDPKNPIAKRIIISESEVTNVSIR